MKQYILYTKRWNTFWKLYLHHQRWRSSMSITRPVFSANILSCLLTTSWPHAPFISWPISFRTVVRMSYFSLRTLWKHLTFAALVVLNWVVLPTGLKGIKLTTCNCKREMQISVKGCYYEHAKDFKHQRKCKQYTNYTSIVTFERLTALLLLQLKQN